MSQDGDVLLYQTNDGGTINVVNGITEMAGGLETSVYLSLFGGNEDDDGSADNPFNWWGNLDESDPVNHYRSRTQNLLQSLPAITGNLRRIENAVKSDLNWLLEKKIASALVVTVSIPSLNAVKIVVDINADNADVSFEFVENWKALV